MKVNIGISVQSLCSMPLLDSWTITQLLKPSSIEMSSFNYLCISISFSPMHLFYDVSKLWYNLHHLTAKNFTTSSLCSYLLFHLTDSFQMFIVVLIQYSCLLQRTQQHPLCFISYVLLQCIVPLEVYYLWDLFRTIRKSLLVHPHTVLQNNKNLEEKIIYHIIHGNKSWIFHFSQDVFTKNKLTDNLVSKKISHFRILYKIISLLGIDTCCVFHKGWDWFTYC